MTASVGGARDGVVRAALSDLYFHSMRLVGLNLLWGLGLLAIVFAALAWSPVSLVLTPILAIPAVGTFRMAARIVRQEGDRSISGVLATSASRAIGTVASGGAVLIAVIVLGSNAVIGLSGTQPFGWLLGTLAVWGLVLLWAVCLVALPLLADPLRADDSLGERMRLAVAVLLAHPRRFAVVGASMAVFVVVSAVLTIVLLTTSLALAALIACRIVYPLADRQDLAMRHAS